MNFSKGKNKKKFKIRVYKLSDKVICYLCETPLRYSEATVDHYIPRAMGGPDQKKNYEICCEKCNLEKDCVMPTHFHKEQRKKNRISDKVRYGKITRKDVLKVFPNPEIKPANQNDTIYKTVLLHPDKTSAELAKVCYLDRWQIARRLNEIKEIEKVGRKKCTICGKQCFIWRIKSD